jgi:leucyl/phenylalanyl-tRNA--protein transferase
MPVYRLPKELVFPDPACAAEGGLLAVGGDLSLQRLLLAYSRGIFPWYADGDPILWWSPDPRLILDPGGLRVSKSLKRTIKKKVFTVSMDRCFGRVVKKCATVKRKHEPGTWITDAMIAAYIRLHKAGFAHSVEVWDGRRLVGGLYGVSLGRAFFGESMFSQKTDASKVALVCLAGALRARGIDLLDCQVSTEHLVRMGARAIPRAEFLRRLDAALAYETGRGAWEVPEQPELIA